MLIRLNFQENELQRMFITQYNKIIMHHSMKVAALPQNP
jgi:hypothetical protein